MSVIGSTDIEMIKCDGVNSTVANYLFRKAELNPVCRVGGAGGGGGGEVTRTLFTCTVNPGIMMRLGLS